MRMRTYEIVMRSGAKSEVTAEIMYDDPALDTKIYFYRDTGQKQLVAYYIPVSYTHLDVYKRQIYKIVLYLDSEYNCLTNTPERGKWYASCVYIANLT